MDAENYSDNQNCCRCRQHIEIPQAVPEVFLSLESCLFYLLELLFRLMNFQFKLVFLLQDGAADNLFFALFCRGKNRLQFILKSRDFSVDFCLLVGGLGLCLLFDFVNNLKRSFEIAAGPY
jgi:hypothetical protein